MKLYVTFRGDEATRFLVLCPDDSDVGALRRRIASDFREIFPAKPPLCFFRISSAADGFFLTDAARVGEVLADGDSLVCERADAEFAGAPLRENPSAAEVEALLETARAQLAYVARPACRAALWRADGLQRSPRSPGSRSGRSSASRASGFRGDEEEEEREASAAASAMSVVLAMLVVGGGGSKFVELQVEALQLLRQGLTRGAAGLEALSAFLASGGLFVLLGLLSPSTRMDASSDVVEAAAALLAELVAEHGEALVPVLRDCAPSRVLTQIAAEHRGAPPLRASAAAVLHWLPDGEDDTMRGKCASTQALASSAGPAATGAARQALPAMAPTAAASLAPASAPPQFSSAAALKELLAAPAGVQQRETHRRALEALERAAETTEGLRACAECPLFLEALRRALAADGVAPGGDSSGASATWLPALGRLIMRAGGDPGSRTALARNLARAFAKESANGNVPTRELAEPFATTWPRLPAEFRRPLAAALEEALGTGAEETAEGGAASRPLRALAAFLDTGSPEELQATALRALRRIARDDDGNIGSGAGAALTPKLVNTALLRQMPKQPLLCLDVLASLALKEHFREFLCTQTSLLRFLAHCCEQPAAAASASSVATEAYSVNGRTSGAASQAPSADAAALQRTAARCLANLCVHPVARDWVRHSPGLRGALARAEDLATKTYLGVALGTGPPPDPAPNSSSAGGFGVVSGVGARADGNGQCPVPDGESITSEAC
eukprot:TRINITY_DN56252_c0_g1_i1.p1 TRINITY_DN56252_c0_g1~~TRINITY_DN56252_c0_g1_i1.p1  ORF type:complete len:755 (+),score=193.07 TRINITY_DN56252_c0_g1_i1:66-2267(+)